MQKYINSDFKEELVSNVDGLVYVFDIENTTD